MSKVQIYDIDADKISHFGEHLQVEYNGRKVTFKALDQAKIYDTRHLNFNQKVVVYNQVYEKLTEYKGDLRAFFQEKEKYQAWTNELIKEVHEYAYPKIKAQNFTTPQSVDIDELNEKLKSIGRKATVKFGERLVDKREFTYGEDKVKDFLDKQLAKCSELFTSKGKDDKIVQRYVAAGVVITSVSEEELERITGTKNHEGYAIQEFDHTIARCDEVARRQFKDGEIHKLKLAGPIKRLFKKETADETSMTKGVLQTKIAWDDVLVDDEDGTLETRMHYKIINDYGAGSPSNDRVAEDPHAMRVIEGRDKDGEMVPHAYAGRAENKAKARKVIAFVFEQEFLANRQKYKNTKTDDNRYHLRLAVQSLCKTEVLDDGEYKKFTLAERKAYQDLLGEPLNVQFTDVDGTEYDVTVVLDEVFLSNTALNGTCYFQNRLLPEWWSHRKERALKDADESDRRLFDKIKQGQNANDLAYLNTKKQFDTRRHLLQPWEELLLREHLYILAEVPGVTHCKSSKDRTGIALAIRSALRQWIADPTKIVEDNDILTLVHDDKFKELVLRKLIPGIASSQYNTMTAGLKLVSPLRDASLMKLLPESCKQFYWPNAIGYGIVLSLIVLPLLLSAGLAYTLIVRYFIMGLLGGLSDRLDTLINGGWNPTPPDEQSGWNLASSPAEEYFTMFKDLYLMWDLWSHRLTPEAAALVFGTGETND